MGRVTKLTTPNSETLEAARLGEGEIRDELTFQLLKRKDALQGAIRAEQGAPGGPEKRMVAYLRGKLAVVDRALRRLGTEDV